MTRRIHWAQARDRNATWCTPPEILAALGEFDLDPAGALPGCPLPPTAREIWRGPEIDGRDGLAEPWHGRVWLNPPYGRGHVDRFMAKLAEHGHGTALVNASTSSPWWERSVASSCSALCFLGERVSFRRPETGEPEGSNGGAASVLIAYGTTDADALKRSQIPGSYYLAAPDLLVPRPRRARGQRRPAGDTVVERPPERGAPRA
jgi:hypothetical protein